MRLTHARRTAVILVAGIVMLCAALWGILAATAAAVAAAAAVTPASSESCEPLQAATASPSPSATKTSATPTVSPATTKATATPTATTATPTATATTATPTPTATTATPTPTPTPVVTATTAGTTTAGTASSRAAVLTAAIVPASAATVSVCVEVQPMEQSLQPGQAAQWAVAAWVTGGNVPDVKIQLLATNSVTGSASFSFGCGNSDRTPSCDLGAVDATSAQRQLQAQAAVPLTADVSSVSLTATASAANLHTDPKASASIAVLPSAALAGVTTSLPLGTLTGSSPQNLMLSPGGNASSLFPTLAPQSPQTEPGTFRQLADTSAPAKGTFPLGAQAAGLAVLALACVVAITRVSVRRPAPPQVGAATPPQGAPTDSPEQPKGPEDH